jgi:hypothetical protein
MDKISIELFDSILKDCAKRLENPKLSKNQKNVYLKTIMTVNDIVMTDVELKK